MSLSFEDLQYGNLKVRFHYNFLVSELIYKNLWLTPVRRVMVLSYENEHRLP